MLRRLWTCLVNQQVQACKCYAHVTMKQEEQHTDIEKRLLLTYHPESKHVPVFDLLAGCAAFVLQFLHQPSLSMLLRAQRMGVRYTYTGRQWPTYQCPIYQCPTYQCPIYQCPICHALA